MKADGDVIQYSLLSQWCFLQLGTENQWFSCCRCRLCSVCWCIVIVSSQDLRTPDLQPLGRPILPFLVLQTHLIQPWPSHPTSLDPTPSIHPWTNPWPSHPTSPDPTPSIHPWTNPWPSRTTTLTSSRSLRWGPGRTHTSPGPDTPAPSLSTAVTPRGHMHLDTRNTRRWRRWRKPIKLTRSTNIWNTARWETERVLIQGDVIHHKY